MTANELQTNLHIKFPEIKIIRYRDVSGFCEIVFEVFLKNEPQRLCNITFIFSNTPECDILKIRGIHAYDFNYQSRLIIPIKKYIEFLLKLEKL